MHHGCVADANDGEEGRGGVVADIAKLSVGREAYYTRELATDHEQYLSGHGESPGRWYGAGATTVGLQGEAFVNERLTWNLNHRDSDDLGGLWIAEHNSDEREVASDTLKLSEDGARGRERI